MQKLTLGELSRRLRKLSLPVLQEQTQKIILQDPKIVNRKKAEFKGGIRPSGKIIGKYRSEGYRLFKLQKNPLARGNVDLILTGSTKNQLILVAKGDGSFTFESNDSKWVALVEKYGVEIKGINEEVFDGLQKRTYGPELVKKMKQITGL